MADYTTWITIKDGKVDRVREVDGDKSPGKGWKKVPNDWGGHKRDDLSWYDDDGRRIPDSILVKEGKRKDNRGLWYHKEKIGERVQIDKLDKDPPGESYTREKPLENESFQKWDPKKEKFVVDKERKEEAENERLIAEKKSAIQLAEQQKLRSLIAKIEGVATEEDEEYYAKYSVEIETLRTELRALQEE